MTDVTQQDLEAPLKQGLQYYDATPSIEALAEEVRQLSNRMAGLERLLALQSNINGTLLENMNQILLQNADLRAERSSSPIIMPN